ncbi:MAG: hypothetical protein CNE98_02995 [Bacteroidetes bacterium MED-G17]|nr:MAG: hypothetical protein CNE98_02995 [Bacteroidetes bacterium MED-G17]|tara:strand:- start:1345 stop:1602 length:258 start_codon:yes stop_codon:yes gene_type:complete
MHQIYLFRLNKNEFGLYIRTVTQEFHVQGITCANCEKKVIAAVQGLEQAEIISLDPNSGKLLLKSTDAKLKEKLENNLPKKFSLA